MIKRNYHADYDISGSDSVGMKMAVFWVAVPCNLVEVYRRFKGDCCFHFQLDDHCPDMT
jgi:hypothetical protein